MGELNVSFQSETDNVENFPTVDAFQAFRKQRDLFYEIFRTWQENHLIQSWSFQLVLARNVQSLLRIHNDTANFCHFARLFKSQFLISCIQNSQVDDMADDESLSFLRTLQHVSPKKLTQLRKRLVTPLPPKDHVGEPSFPGVQEFFKDFVIHAFDPIFYVHLENCLVHEIMELNDTQFTSCEIEDSETMVDDRTQQNFITCLASLRLLAKMLGLLVSLPYKLKTHNTDAMIASQIEMRSRVLPSLNLEVCLRNALVQRNLSLTVPWITEYLAMMDVVTLRLPYYKRILEVLYYVHWAIKHCELSDTAANADVNASTIDNTMSKRATLLLNTTLAWLFQLPPFPKEQYPTWAKNCASWELKSLRQLDKHILEMSFMEPVTSVTPLAKGNLDKLDIINDRILRACCPTLELKASTATITTKPTATVPATAANTHSSRGPTSKHITLVSSQLCKKAAGSTGAKHLQAKLEEAFFHGQPASTRKTVDFVAERVASTCVKHICNTQLSSARENNLSAFKKILCKHYNERPPRRQQQPLQEERKNSTDEVNDPAGLTNVTNLGNLSSDVEDFKSCLVEDMNALTLNTSKHLKEECEKTILAICEARVAKAIESLLAEDSLPAVKETCIKIAVRLAMERINEWIQSHIVGGSLFMKDMEVEINRFLRNSGPTYSARPKDHNPNAPSPAKVIQRFRSFIWALIENGGECLTEAVVLSAMEDLYETLHERGDLLPIPKSVVYALSIDFALFLVSYRLDLYTDKVQEKFIQVWSTKDFNTEECESPILRLLSPRNVMLLGQSENLETWVAFGQFIRKLLKRNILDINVLSDQCVILFRQCWPVPILKLMSKCLREAIEDYNATDQEAEKIKYLLGWIAETYQGIESYDYEIGG